MSHACWQRGEDDLPLWYPKQLTRCRIIRGFEHDLYLGPNVDRIGRRADNVAQNERSRRIVYGDEDDGVGHVIGQERVRRIVSDDHTLNSPASHTLESGEFETLTRFADFLGWVLDVPAALALLECQHTGREEGSIQIIQGRQSPPVAKHTFHTSAPKTTALPGAMPGPATTIERSTSAT